MYRFYVLLLILYCVVHSVLADNFLLKRVYYSWWYRLFYVILSVILLIPIFYVYFKLPEESLFYYSNRLLYFIGIAGLAFGVYATQSYDNLSFLGLRQVSEFVLHRKVHEDSKQISFKGALRIVRHPYYLAGMLILWGRPLYIRDLILNLIFTAYFITGAFNEERKLLKTFGKSYQVYRDKVPMFIPRFFKR